ncbi:hypothetical protein GWK08_18675 [Leptobacterium flavescens]|uniref:Uncharacterized protein n=1 Tax=Leptobacterium flavescens TaxID=472055 RepID=A0A6P0UYG2_9FLAO|nr:DUF6090 family protein [Leptobacterium flavescens]NER15486.1 hypothetical protein [Leptobacterium flavescens]
MIHFFRKLRGKLLSENKLSQYFIYAIGEIVLVVLGILIALQINNWNEGRKARRAETRLMENILKDLKEDHENLKGDIEYLEAQKQLQKQLYLESRKLAEPIEGGRYDLILIVVDLYSITADNHKGAPDNISDEDIRSTLNKYFRDHTAAEVTIGELTETIKTEVRPFFKTLGGVNLQTVFDDSYYENNALNMDRLREEFGSPEFDSMLANLYVISSSVINKLQELLKLNEELSARISSTVNFQEP